MNALDALKAISPAFSGEYCRWRCPKYKPIALTLDQLRENIHHIFQYRDTDNFKLVCRFLERGQYLRVPMDKNDPPLAYSEPWFFCAPMNWCFSCHRFKIECPQEICNKCCMPLLNYDRTAYYIEISDRHHKFYPYTRQLPVIRKCLSLKEFSHTEKSSVPLFVHDILDSNSCDSVFSNMPLLIRERITYWSLAIPFTRFMFNENFDVLNGLIQNDRSRTDLRTGLSKVR